MTEQKRVHGSISLVSFAFLRVYPALSLDAYGLHTGLFFSFHMVFQRNCARDRTGHMKNVTTIRHSSALSK